VATAEAIKPIITPLDRFGLTLSLAILLHALIILGITFTKEDRSLARYNTMEIVLVQQKSPEPEDAKVLAQESLEGGGNVDEAVTPSAPMPAPFPNQKPKVTMPKPADQEPPKPQESATAETMVEDPSLVKKELDETLTVEDPESPTPMAEKIDTPSKEKKITETSETDTTKRIITPEKERIKKTIKKPRIPTAAQLIKDTFDIATLTAKIDRQLIERAKRPRQKWISAKTKQFDYAAYMDSWRQKVERIGNLNYPQKAIEQHLSGSVRLDVALNQDGSINKITIIASSGEKILEDSAIRIVRLAAPYSPFPQHIKDDTDILHIIRTWKFIDQRGFK